jgi:hypothetical protein
MLGWPLPDNYTYTEGCKNAGRLGDLVLILSHAL